MELGACVAEFGILLKFHAFLVGDIAIGDAFSSVFDIEFGVFVSIPVIQAGGGHDDILDGEGGHGQLG